MRRRQGTRGHAQRGPDAIDAERPAVKGERLRALLNELRRLLRDEVPLRLHRVTPVEQDSFGHEIGQPFTLAFSRYIGHPDGWGKTRTGMSSILEISEWCHGRHTSHEIPGNSRSLCAQLVYEASYLGKGLTEISATHSLPSTQAAGMLTSALTHAAQWRERAEPLQTDYDAPDPLLRTA